MGDSSKVPGLSLSSHTGFGSFGRGEQCAAISIQGGFRGIDCLPCEDGADDQQHGRQPRPLPREQGKGKAGLSGVIVLPIYNQ